MLPGCSWRVRYVFVLKNKQSSRFFEVLHIFGNCNKSISPRGRLVLSCFLHLKATKCMFRLQIKRNSGEHFFFLFLVQAFKIQQGILENLFCPNFLLDQLILNTFNRGFLVFFHSLSFSCLSFIFSCSLSHSCQLISPLSLSLFAVNLQPSVVAFFLPLILSFLPPSSVSLTLSVFLCPDKGGESGRRWSLQRAGDFPDPGDKSRPGLLPRPPGPPDLLGVRSLSVYLPPPEVGRAKQQRGGDHLLRHHPGRTNHHCGIGDKSPCHRPTARQ